MQPLPLRASEDIVRLLHQPVYSNQRFRLWLSYFEIYGGKLFDLLSDRRLEFGFHYCFLIHQNWVAFSCVQCIILQIILKCRFLLLDPNPYYYRIGLQSVS